MRIHAHTFNVLIQHLFSLFFSLLLRSEVIASFYDLSEMQFFSFFVSFSFRFFARFTSVDFLLQRKMKMNAKM